MSSITSFFTPATLFLLLNLVVGTIVFISRLTNNRIPQHQQQQQQHEHHYNYNYHQNQLMRAPSSLLERVRSINFSLYKFGPETTPFHPNESENHGNVNRIERRPSLLERVKSINFSPFYSPETEHHHGPGFFSSSADENPTHIERKPSLLERVKETEHGSGLVAGPGQENPTRIERKPSLLERVRSIKFSSPTRVENEPEPEHENGSGLVSGSEGRRLVKRAGKMKKSASEREMEAEEGVEEVERRRPATVRVERTASVGGDDEEVDAKADDFINRFKHQLKLQRLDSLLRYRDAMKAKH